VLLAALELLEVVSTVLVFVPMVSSCHLIDRRPTSPGRVWRAAPPAEMGRAAADPDGRFDSAIPTESPVLPVRTSFRPKAALATPKLDREASHSACP
jgi:hypothetical protein